MVERPTRGLTAEVVERRLEELRSLYELGMALREVRRVDPQLPDRVSEATGEDELRGYGGGEEPRGR